MTENGWDRRRHRVSLAIESAAVECFAKDGFHAVTVEQIAQAAGIHERTFFRYFTTKEDVLLALPRRGIEAVCAALRDRPADEPLFEAFGAAVASAGVVLADEDKLRMVWATVVNNAPDVVARLSGEGTMLLFDAVAEAVAKRIDDSLDSLRVGVVASAAVGVMHHLWRGWLSEGAQGDVAARIAEGFRLLESTELHPRQDDRLELERLRAEVADLSLEREIFKRAAAALVERGSKAPGATKSRHMATE